MSLMSLKGAIEFDMYMMTWRGHQSSQPCDIFQVEEIRKSMPNSELLWSGLRTRKNNDAKG